MLIVIALCIVITVPVACRKQSRWDEADQASQGGTAVAEDAVPGSTLNAFFPESGEGFKITFTQEKKGFAQADLDIDGQKAATLSISDTVSNPSAADKFKESTETLAGYPMVQVGSKGTAILVADRFQVQIRSVEDDFDRESWLAEFDLDGLDSL
jgi:hypothetical protein